MRTAVWHCRPAEHLCSMLTALKPCPASHFLACIASAALYHAYTHMEFWRDMAVIYGRYNIYQWIIVCPKSMMRMALSGQRPKLVSMPAILDMQHNVMWNPVLTSILYCSRGRAISSMLSVHLQLSAGGVLPNWESYLQAYDCIRRWEEVHHCDQIFVRCSSTGLVRLPSC